MVKMHLLNRKDQTSRHNTIFLVLIAFLSLASFYYQPNLGGSGLSLPFNYTTWIVALIIIAVSVFLVFSSSRLILPGCWLWLLALPGGLLISGVVAETIRPVEWSLRQGFVIGGFLFFFSLFQFRPDKRGTESLLFLLVLAGLLHTLVAYIQLFDSNWLRGWIPPSYTDRPEGIFQQYNLMASLAATNLAISFYLTTTAGFVSRSLPYKLLIYASILLQPAIIVASSSRTGLLGLLSGLVLLIASRYRYLLARKGNLLILSTALLLGLGYGFYISDSAKQLQEKVSRDGYQNSRLVVYQLSWELVKEKPLFGHGLGSFPKVYQEKRIAFQKEYPEESSPISMYDHPHNELLYWLVEAGMVSVVGMLLFAVATLRQLFKLGWQRGAAYLAMIAPITIHTLLELPFYLSAWHWFVWLLLLYLIHSHNVVEYANRPSLVVKRLAPVASIGVLLFIVIFLVNTLQASLNLARFAMRGDGNMALVEGASKNPLLNEESMLYSLRYLLYSEISKNQSAHIRRFIEWADDYTENMPRPAVMSDLALAYAYMNEADNAKQVIARAVSIYPKNPYLVEQQKQIHAGNAVDYFRQTKMRVRQ